MVPSPSSDFETVVKAWYPNMESLCGKLIETLDKINQVARFQLESARRFSLRDLLKRCKRIAGLGSCFSGDNLYERVYEEAVDVFTSSSSSGEMRSRILKELAAIWWFHA